ncbi:MAG TPA: lipoate protein ligase C-terminal domain-containing protein [Candidatus Bilamarchaeum sp.]|nr:lipoate protein ligase C-terminal domain-containing protein [Candidatus Bilamarchaeum sp.]
MRCEEKIPNGKLVCVEVWAKGGLVERAKITGDFFLHPEERISDLERALEGLPLSASEGDAASALEKALGKATLIGASTADLARIFRKAVNG